jgi:hypothetical protein
MTTTIAIENSKWLSPNEKFYAFVESAQIVIKYQLFPCLPLSAGVVLCRPFPLNNANYFVFI